jgi:hypothetical protein
MTERWQQRLESLETIEPSEEVLANARRMRPGGRPSSPRGRVIAIATALIVAAAGIGGAVIGLSGSRQNPPPATATARTFHAVWPEQTYAQALAAQQLVDEGDQTVAWRTNPKTVARRFAETVLGLVRPMVREQICEGPACPDSTNTFFINPECTTCRGPKGVASPRESVDLHRLVHHGSSGIWSVVQVRNEGLALVLPARERIHAGESMMMRTSVPPGEQLDVGYTYVGPCGRLTWFTTPEPRGGWISAQVRDAAYPTRCGPGDSPAGTAQAASVNGVPLPLTDPVDGYVFAYRGRAGERPVDPLYQGGHSPIRLLAVIPARFLPASGGSPLPEVSASTIPYEKPTPIPASVVSSSPDRLVIDAPDGRVRWTIESAGCELRGRSLVTGREAGSLGGTCGGNAYLGWGFGGLNVDGTFYGTSYGRTTPDQPVTIRITFDDSTQIETESHDGWWLAVYRASPNATVVRFEAFDANGRSLASATP